MASTSASLCSAALQLADEWTHSIHLSLDIRKCNSMLLHSARKRNLPHLALHLKCKWYEAPWRSHQWHLTWSNHNKYVLSRVGRRISLLRRLSWCLPHPALVVFYNSYITPSLDYCDAVRYNCAKPEADTMERLQNCAAHVILYQKWYSSESEARKEHHLKFFWFFPHDTDCIWPSMSIRLCMGSTPNTFKQLFVSASTTQVPG